MLRIIQKSFSALALIATLLIPVKADFYGKIVCCVAYPHPTAEELSLRVIRLLKKAGYEHDKNIKYDFAIAPRDFIKAVHNNKTIYIAFTTPAAQKLLKEKKDDELLVFSSITSPQRAGLLGEPTVTGVVNYVPVVKQLVALNKLLPAKKRVAILHNPEEENSNYIVQNAKEAAKDLDIDLVEIALDNPEALERTLRKYQGEYDLLLINHDNLGLSLMPRIVNILAPQNIPVVSSDRASLKYGAMMTMGVDEEDVAVATVEVLKPILKGESPEKVNIKFLQEMKIRVNKNAVEKFNIKLDEDLLKSLEAEKETGSLID